ncbi:MAG: universal stress protein [Paludibacter sp.]|nr:universal stress protein [Paludibacter sp.]
MKKNKVQKILIAMDFHPTSEKVAEVGFAMAKSLGAEVVLLHVKVRVVDYSLIYKKMGSLKLETVEELALAAEHFLKNSKHKLSEDLVKTLVKEGDFAISILDAAKEMAIDLIVMGSNRTRWLEEIVLGRVTNKVLQQSKIPILIAPTRKNDSSNTFISLEDNAQGIGKLVE